MLQLHYFYRSRSIDPGFGLKSLFTLHYFGLIQRSKLRLKVPISHYCLNSASGYPTKTKKNKMMSALKISHAKGIPTEKNTHHEGCRIVCFLVLCIHISVLLIFPTLKVSTDMCAIKCINVLMIISTFEHNLSNEFTKLE